MAFLKLLSSNTLSELISKWNTNADEYDVHLAESAKHKKIILSENDPDHEGDWDLWFKVQPDYTDNAYYYKGEEFSGVTGGWVDGDSYAPEQGTRSKETDYMYFETFSYTGISRLGYVTDNKIDLTNINTLYIDWDSIDSNTDNASLIKVTNDKSDNETTNAQTSAVLFIDIRGNFERKVDTLDVSGLTGEYHIQVLNSNGGSSVNRYGKTRVYRVWGE